MTNTILYGDIPAPVLDRDWLRTKERIPYRKTYRLKPGQSWFDAESTRKQWESYVHQDDGPVPSGALIARELVEEGASEALWTECYGAGEPVFMSPDMVCVKPTDELMNVLQQIWLKNGNRWAGLPDAIGVFPDGRIAMREAKVAGKDRLSQNQHTFARIARALFGTRVEFCVVEWGRGVKE